MVQIPDGSVILTGNVLAAQPRRDFETKAVTGQEFTVLSGDGMALLRVTNEDFGAMQADGITPPTVGTPVAVLARPSAYSRSEGMGNVTYRLVRPVTVHDLEALASVVGVAAKSS